MSGNQHLLVVDDDREIRTLLAKFLSTYDYRVSTAENGVAMMQALETARIDLVILDIMMPGEDGISLCRKLRVNNAVPVIMLTAVGEEADRIIGLEMGADDYLAKPFSTRELLARIRAVLRRSASPIMGSPGSRAHIFEFLGWRLDVTRRQLFSPDHVLVDLKAAEFELLLAFVERPQHVLTRDQLLDLSRGRTAAPFDRSVDVNISRLRRRIEIDLKEPRFIKTVRGGGYVFAAPVTVQDASS